MIQTTPNSKCDTLTCGLWYLPVIQTTLTITMTLSHVVYDTFLWFRQHLTISVTLSHVVYDTTQWFRQHQKYAWQSQMSWRNESGDTTKFATRHTCWHPYFFLNYFILAFVNIIYSVKKMLIYIWTATNLFHFIPNNLKLLKLCAIFLILKGFLSRLAITKLNIPTNHIWSYKYKIYMESTW